MQLNFANVFRNEILSKVNQLKRSGVFETGPWSFNCLSSGARTGWADALVSVKYYCACIVNLLWLIVTPKSVDDRVFFFVNKRNLKFNCWGGVPCRIGLFNFRYFEYTHIYSVLKNSEIFHCIIRSLFLVKVFNNEMIGLALDIGVDNKVVRSIVGNPYFRVLDCLLAERAILKVKKVSTSGHFDIYTAIASELRRHRLIKSYFGNQHGLYEVFSQANPYKMTFDKYCLMFSESEIYVRDKLIFSDGLEILNSPKSNLELTLCDYVNEGGKIIAFGFQNDNLKKDISILESFTAYFYDPKYVIVVYLHPQSSPAILAQLMVDFPQVRFELKNRFSNIDILITRYSTIGIDYALIGVNAIFVLGEENICISQSSRKEIRVVYSDDEAIVETTKCLAGETFQ